MLERYKAQLPPAAFAATTEGDRTDELGAMATRLLAELSVPLPAAGVSPGAGLGQSKDSAIVELLTERERTILGFIAEGLSNQEIADRLILSLGTVKWYTGQIYSKLGVQTRTQAVAHARMLHMLP